MTYDLRVLLMVILLDRNVYVLRVRLCDCECLYPKCFVFCLVLFVFFFSVIIFLLLFFMLDSIFSQYFAFYSIMRG